MLGVVTTFYNSLNYGGVLQAYALQKKLLEYGIKNEIINYMNGDYPIAYKIIQSIPCEDFRRYPYMIKHVIDKKKKGFIANNERRSKFNSFKEGYVKTSSLVYNAKQFDAINEKYDAFLCGSDQVWNPGNKLLPNPFYSLSFTSKSKYSYAAALARKNITWLQMQFIKKELMKYSMISVREKFAKDILERTLNKTTTLTCDPVYLLEPKEWFELASEPICKKKYIYDYRLGAELKSDDVKINVRELGYEYIFDNGTLPMGPREWIWVIQNAECIITNSFHALAFSVLFQKKVILLKRKEINKYDDMNIRLLDLLNILELKIRLSDADINTIDKVLSMEVEYDMALQKLEELREESFEFLRNIQI